jgi:hypothetical protein
MRQKKYYGDDLLIENIDEPFPLEFGNRTPLTESHPDLAAQWHYGKNCGYRPEDFSYGSGLKVWWKCPTNRRHVWQKSIGVRAIGGLGCPHCCAELWGIDLRDYPNVLKCFDEKKNPDISPYKLPVSRKVWWRCNKNKSHIWKRYFQQCLIDSFCPFCRKLKNCHKNNLTIRPDLLAEFHPTRNRKLNPELISLGSAQKIWWQCLENSAHQWQARVGFRVQRKSKCPFCCRRRFSKDNSLLKEYPDLAQEWHKTKNGALKPSQISSLSRERVWWKCPKGDDHEWQTSLDQRTYMKTGCPFCKNKISSKGNSLESLYPEIADEFDIHKNAPLVPGEVIATTNKKCWWKCRRGHSWQREVRFRTLRGSKCPECPGYGKRDSEKPLLEVLPGIAEYWHPVKNGTLTPADLSSQSGKKFWLICANNPEHEWERRACVATKSGYKCPFCVGRQACSSNSIQLLHPLLVGEWISERNDKAPKNLVPGSNYRAWWRCGSCKHEWQRACYLRTQKKSTCPQCGNHPELTEH